MTRDPFIIDQELRAVALVRVAEAKLGWESSTVVVDELLDERLRAVICPLWP